MAEFLIGLCLAAQHVIVGAKKHYNDSQNHVGDKCNSELPLLQSDFRNQKLKFYASSEVL